LSDEPFFREWAGRGAGERRSLDRAGLFAEQLGLPLPDLHPLVVVGSKGKGTAAAYAAATLRASGLSVGLVTSPGYRSHHERIRYNGTAIADAEFERLARDVGAALERLPERQPGDGYVSPTGAFTIAGLSWLCRQGCDALVVEAGMGGRSDESSLTRPSVVVITEIFEEHLGILGEDLVEVAHDKAGIISASTRSVLSAPQGPIVRQVIEDVAGRYGAPVEFLAPTGEAAFPGLDKLPTPLMRMNAHLGMRAAHAYRYEQVHEVPLVQLPGRLSVHRNDGQTWVVDSAINGAGVDAALGWCRRTLGEPTTVLLSIPDSKDLVACFRALDGTVVQLVGADVPHMTFTAPDGGTLPTLAEIDHRDLGDLVLAVGTISFVGEVLDLLDVDMSRLF
jgi:dihydrofolate synthase/folylpolyglutamate synthase